MFVVTITLQSRKQYLTRRKLGSSWKPIRAFYQCIFIIILTTNLNTVKYSLNSSLVSLKHNTAKFIYIQQQQKKKTQHHPQKHQERRKVQNDSTSRFSSFQYSSFKMQDQVYIIEYGSLSVFVYLIVGPNKIILHLLFIINIQSAMYVFIYTFYTHHPAASAEKIFKIEYIEHLPSS